jgi:hypothetical protein
MRLQTQRWTRETQKHTYWPVVHKWKTELVALVFGSIVGLAIFAALILYIRAVVQQ